MAFTGIMHALFHLFTGSNTVRNAALLAALLLSSFIAGDSRAEEGLRPVTHEDLWTMRRLATQKSSEVF